MPSKVTTIRGSVSEGADATVVARIVTADGTDLQQADLTGTSGQEIAYSVFDLDGDTPGTAIATGTLNKTAVVFDTLQTDGWWNNEDEFGYNFRHTIANTELPGGGHRARIEYSGESSTFGDIKWAAEITVLEGLAVAQ